MYTKKSLNINCGEAVIFTYKPETFDSVDAININCGSAVFSRRAYAELSKKTFNCNSGKNVLLDIEGPVIDLSGTTYIDAGRNLDGMFVYSGDDLIVNADGFASLEKVTGIYAPTLYYPESCAIGSIPNVQATLVAYPDGAVLKTGSFELTASALSALEENAVVWVGKRLTATDKKALAQANARGMRFKSRSLLIYEDDSRQYADMLTFKSRTCIPEGYTLVTGDLTLDDAAIAIYGSKIYVMGDLFVSKADEALMAQMEGLIAEGEAVLPLGAVAAFKKIGQAEEIKAYKGILWKIKGEDTADHAFFRQAAQMGQTYTISVLGCLTFADDVTAEDIKVIEKLNYNGYVKASPELAASLRPVIGSANGHMDTGTEDNADEDEKQPEAAGNCIAINTGVYKSI